MSTRTVIVTNKQYELIQELTTLVSLIGKATNFKSYSGYIYKYYYLIYTNFKDIEYMVSHFDETYLKTFIIDDVWIYN